MRGRSGRVMATRYRLLSEFLNDCHYERQELCRKLDLRMDSKDWKTLAGHLKISWQDVLLIEQKEREPSAHLLLRYSMEHSKATLVDLLTLLEEMGRDDAVDILEPLLFKSDTETTPAKKEKDAFMAAPPPYEDTACTSSTPYFPGHEEASSTPYFPGHEEGPDRDDLIADFGILNLHDLDKPVIGKVALLIGNQNYVDVQLRLKTPHNDVKVLRTALERLGFKVMSLVDLTKPEMRKAILSFTTFLGRCMYAVFFFGGHGFEGLNASNGDVETFLVPVDANVQCNLDDCIKLQEDVLDTIQECDTAMNLIIVDTCRKWKASPCRTDGHSLTNKSRRSVNLRSKGNTVFGFSTSSAKQAYETHSGYLSDSQQNSLYVKYLKQHLELDIGVEQVLKITARDLVSNHHFIQIPTVVTNLIRDCKLTDPVVPGDDPCTQQQLLRWSNITDLPRYESFSLKGFSLCPKFYQQFSNELLMLLFVRNDNTFAVRDFEIRAGQPGHGVLVRHEPRISTDMTGSDGPSDQREFVAQISIGGLQRLEEGVRELSLPLTMSYHDDTDRVPDGITLATQEITFEIDLGNPLIATASANWDAFVTGTESVRSEGQ